MDQKTSVKLGVVYNFLIMSWNNFCLKKPSSESLNILFGLIYIEIAIPNTHLYFDCVGMSLI